MRRDCTYLHLPDCESVMRLSEEAKYMVHLVVKRNEVKIANKKGYVYLRSVDLKEIYSRGSDGTRGWKYPKIEKELDGVIDIEPKWWPGKRSKGFKLIGEAANAKVKGYQMPDGKFKNSVLRYAEKKKAKKEIETKEAVLKSRYLRKDGTELRSYDFLDRNNKRLGIREEEALAYINNPENIRKIIEKNEKTRSKKSTKQREIDVWNHYFMKIDELAIGNYMTTKPSKTGRLFNDVTNFPKAERQFLFDKINPNENLFELDLKNSQPFCSIELMNEYYGNKGIKVKSICGDILEKMPNDVKFYIKLVCEGEIYEYFMERLGMEKDMRGEFKIKFYKGFFFCNPIKCNREILKVFEDDFPNVLKVIKFYKSFECLRVQKLDKDILEKRKGPHCNFIRRLQSIESDLIINKVIRRIAKEKGDIFAVTIHDSIICGESNVDYVERVMNEEIMKMFGMVPQIGKKRIAMNETRMEKAG